MPYTATLGGGTQVKSVKCMVGLCSNVPRCSRRASGNNDMVLLSQTHDFVDKFNHFGSGVCSELSRLAVATWNDGSYIYIYDILAIC